MNQPVFQGFADLPPYSAVLSVPGGELELRHDTKHNQFAVLLLSPAERRELLILATQQAPAHDRASLRGMAINAGYTVATTQYAASELIGDLNSYAQARSEEDQGVAAANDEESVQWLDTVMTNAVEIGATDIHLEVRDRPGASRVRCRVHGALETVQSPEPKKMAQAIAASFTVFADPDTRNMPTFSQTNERSCIIQRTILGILYRFRFESFPVMDGLDCVLRILPQHVAVHTLEELGYAPYHVRVLSLAARASKGLITIIGTTGSGKSTAARSLLAMHPHGDSIKTYSLEDPPEFQIRGVSQYAIQRSTDDPNHAQHAYVEGARAFLRADPDQVFLGEVRDAEVGSVLVTLVLTGHNVITTLHASSALDAVIRLSHSAIGIDRQTLGARGFLAALVYQALLPKLCPHCAVPADTLPAHYLRTIQEAFVVDDLSGMRLRGTGCQHCRKGIVGQTLAAEVVMPDSHLLMLLRDGRDAEAEEYWRLTRRAGFSEPDMEGKTAFEHGFYKCLNGEVDPRDLERAFDPFERYRYSRPVGISNADRGI